MTREKAFPVCGGPHDHAQLNALRAWPQKALLLCVCMIGFCAHSAEEAARPRDAAEAVKEGDVSQWLKYYQRERADPQTPVAPAPSAPVVSGQDEPIAPRNDPSTR